MSPRTARSPARGSSSTWSTPCCIFEGDARPPFPHPARREEPLRRRPTRSACSRCRTRACARCRTRPSCSSAGAISRTPGTAVFAGMEGTRPVLVEIQALVAPTSARHAAPRGRRLGPEPAVHGAGRARSPWRPAARPARRLSERRRRPADHRAGRRPRRGGRPGLLALGRCRSRRSASISARSACRARCGRSAQAQARLKEAEKARLRQGRVSTGPHGAEASARPSPASAVGHITDLVAGVAAQRPRNKPVLHRHEAWPRWSGPAGRNVHAPAIRGLSGPMVTARDADG